MSLSNTSLPNTSPSDTPLPDTPAWQALREHQEEIAPRHMRDLFAEDPERFEKFSRHVEGVLFDFSKNRITEETMRLLFDLAKQADLSGMREAMFAGG